jgi:GNAT superfamily N-acetyltransferase
MTAQQAQASSILRPATAADARCLGVLATQVFLDTYATDGIRPAIAAAVLDAFSTARMTELLTHRDVKICVAEQRGHLIGFAQVTLGAAHDLVKSDAPAELDRLYLQAPFAGRGLGSALLQAAQTMAVAGDAQTLWLTSWDQNHHALDFYARHGYVDQGEADFHMHGEHHLNRVLAKRLVPTPA